MKRLLTTLLLLAVGLAPAKLSAREPTKPQTVTPTDQELVKLVQTFVGDHWYAFYFMDRKVGWQRESWSISKCCYCVETEQLLSMAVMGEENRLSSFTRSCFSKTPPFQIVTHESRDQENDSVIKVRMTRSDNKLEFIVDANGQERTVKSPAAKENLATALPWAGHARMTPGQVAMSDSFDPVQDKRRLTTVEIAERKQPKAPQDPCTRVIITEEGSVSLEGWLSCQGVLLQGTLGDVFKMVRQEMAQAVLMPNQPSDFYTHSMVPATGELDPLRIERTTTTTMRLKGSKGLKLPATGRQQILESGEDWTRIRINACPPADPQAPEAEDSKCNTEFPCDTPAVKAAALQTVGTAENPERKALAISRWIHQNFKYALGSASATADILLQKRTGDCNEFTKVAVLLARALGIPAREVSGLVMAEPNPMRFGYHAWPQFHLGPLGWVDFDPTWGQYPVDAAHITLGFRDDVSAFVHFGSLSIEIEKVDYSDETLTCPR